MTTAVKLSPAVRLKPAGANPSGLAYRSPKPIKQGISGFWFVVPFLVAFVLFLVWPVIYGLWLSFTDTSLARGSGAFTGFANYAEAFADPEVWHTFGNTVLFTVISTVPLVVVALILALLVNLGFKGQWLWRLAFFAPSLLTSSVVTAIWIWLLDPDLGLVNEAFAALGFERVAWLSTEGTAMWAIALTTVWWTVGFNFLLYLAALQNIPQHLYEAAALDGAGGWRRLWSITLPLLGRTTALIVVLQLLSSLKVFDQIYQMTNGGPNGSTRPILEYVYDTGFSGYRLGYASTISYIFFAIIIIIAIVQARVFARRKAQ